MRATAGIPVIDEPRSSARRTQLQEPRNGGQERATFLTKALQPADLSTAGEVSRPGRASVGHARLSGVAAGAVPPAQPHRRLR